VGVAFLIPTLFSSVVVFVFLNVRMGFRLQGGGDTDQDGREKSDAQEKVLPFEENKSPEKVGEDGDPAKANGRGLLNGMDRDCKDFK